MADQIGRMEDDLFLRIGRNLDQDWQEAQNYFVNAFPVVAQLTFMCAAKNQAEFLDMVNNSPDHLFAVQQFCGLGLREAEYRRQVAMRETENDEVNG